MDAIVLFVCVFVVAVAIAMFVEDRKSNKMFEDFSARDEKIKKEEIQRQLDQQIKIEQLR